MRGPCMCGDPYCGSCGRAMGTYGSDALPTVYLCGGINALSDADAKDWREAAKTALAETCEFLDPMRRDYRGKEAESVKEIISGDLADIDASDIVLVSATRPSWGTAMEVFYAFKAGRTVIVVCPDARPSPWLVGHSTHIVKTFAEAFAIINQE